MEIPADATKEDVERLRNEADAWLRAQECPAWLPGAQGCRAGAAPHQEHWTLWRDGREGREVTVRWADPAPDAPRW